MPNFEMAPMPQVEQPPVKKEKPGLIQSIKNKIEQKGREREMKKIKRDIELLQAQRNQSQNFIQINPRGAGAQVAAAIEKIPQIDAAIKAKQAELNQLTGQSLETVEEETEGNMAA